MNDDQTTGIAGLESMHLQWFAEDQGEGDRAGDPAGGEEQNNSSSAQAPTSEGNAPAEGTTPEETGSTGDTELTGGDGDSSGTSAPRWVTSQMPSDLHDKDALHQFEKPSDLAREYLKLSEQQKQGLTRPGEDATEDEWRQYREAAGIPESPEGYEFDTGDSEVDEDLLGWFKDAAYQAGLSQAQAQAMMEEWNASLTPEKQQERLAKQRETSEAQLRSEWGRNFDGNIRLAQKAMSQFAGEDFRSYLEETGAGNDPRMVKAFAEIGRAMTSDGFVGGEAPERQDTEEDVLRRKFPAMYAEWEQKGVL